MNTLRFTKQLVTNMSYSVWEVISTVTSVPTFGGQFVLSRQLKEYYSGTLVFCTGHRAGWHFVSSDDSIDWNLGPTLRGARAELRRRYARGQAKGQARDRTDTRRQRNNAHADRPRVRKRGRNNRRLPRRPR